MTWISVKDRLPEDKTYVLIHITWDNCFDSDDQRGVNIKVAKFVRKTPFQLINYLQVSGDMPYSWQEFGPSSFRGKDVDYWMPISELPTEVKS